MKKDYLTLRHFPYPITLFREIFIKATRTGPSVALAKSQWALLLDHKNIVENRSSQTKENKDGG